MINALIPLYELYNWQPGSPNPAIFSQRKLRSVIRQSIYDWEKIRAMEHLYTCVAKIPQDMLEYENVFTMQINRNREPVYRKLYGCSEKEITEYVLASAAFPAVFRPHEIDGDTYIDGGWADNLPIAPLAKSGFRKIIIIHLNNANLSERLCRARSVLMGNALGCEIIDIYPSIRLNVQDIFSLKESRIEELMECGFEDAKEIKGISVKW